MGRADGGRSGVRGIQSGQGHIVEGRARDGGRHKKDHTKIENPLSEEAKNGHSYAGHFKYWCSIFFCGKGRDT